MRVVTSFANPTIKRLRALHDKRARREEGLFLAEGLRVVAEGVAAGHAPAIVAGTADGLAHPLGRAAAAAAGEVVETSREVLAKVTGKDNPGAVVAAFPVPDATLAGLARGRGPWVVCEGLKDPGNLGTILRTADAAGAGGVILVDQSCDPWSVEAVRASMGAVFTVALARADWAEFLPWLRAGEGRLVGAVLGPDTVDYRAAEYGAPCFLLMGNEQSGLPADYAAACDARVGIPMRGKADSLNVAVAAALLLFEAVRER